MMTYRSGQSDILDVAEQQGGVSTLASPNAGRLYLWFPVGLAARKVTRYLRQLDRGFTTTMAGALTIETGDSDPEELLIDITELLSRDEAADTRCVFKADDDELTSEDIRRVRTVGEVQQLYASSWLMDMVHGERLTSVFQAIVHADQPTRLLGHEALLRGVGHDGRMVLPARLFDTARHCGMVTELDSAAHRSAIRAAAAHDRRRQLFLNFTAEAIRDGAHGLDATMDAIDAAAIARGSVVLEVIEAERTSDVRRLRSVLDAVRDAGVQVALDDIGCSDHARRLIHELRPDYIKLDMGQVRCLVGGPSMRDAERMMDLAQHLQIATIAESVETVEELDWNRQFGATYVQGFLIGRPGALAA